MSSGWLERRRIGKNEGAFCDLVARRQLAAAVQFYEQHLAASAADVSTPLRAIYHLCRWAAEPNEDNFIYLWDLATEANKTSEVRRAGAVMQRLDRHLRLAQILRQRDADAQDELPGTPADEPDTQSAALEHLAAAVLESGRLAKETGGERPAAELARRILGILPAAESLPGPSLVHAQLLAWALLTVGRPERLVGNAPVLAVFPAERAKELRLAAALTWGKLEVSEGRVQQALPALALVAEEAGAAARDAAIVDWGLNSLERNPTAAIKWFSHHLEAAGDAPASALMRFGIALASFKTGQHGDARQLLAALGTDVRERVPAIGEDLYWQACVLSALSHLAATREWPGGGHGGTYLDVLGLPPDAPSGTVAEQGKKYRLNVRAEFRDKLKALAGRQEKNEITKEEFEAQGAQLEAELSKREVEFNDLKGAYDAARAQQRELERSGGHAAPVPPSPVAREVKVKNRVLWDAAQQKIGALIDQLAAAPARWSWWGALLKGLIAYADRNVTLDSAGIARFAAAAEHVQSPAARKRLSEIEATLTSRVNAVEQACALIRGRRFQELREFNDTLLVHFADSVPAQVRAAVQMTLWSNDPSYDPLPELRRIALESDMEMVIGQCIAEINLARAVEQFRQCLESQFASPPPALEHFATAGADGVRLATLATALVHLHRKEPAAAVEHLSRIAADDADPLLAYARFHLAWAMDDARACLALLDHIGPDSPFLQRDRRSAVLATRALLLLQALEGDRPDEALDLIKAAAGGDLRGSDLRLMVVSLVVWLMQHQKPLAARKLLQRIRQELQTEGNASADPALDALRWTCLALEPPVAAQLGQYSACMESAERLVAAAIPDPPAFGGAGSDRRMLAWGKLLRIEAELGLSATATSEELKLRWRSLQRALEDRAGELAGLQPVGPYARLISGLLAALSTDMMVDESTLEGLASAQRDLDLDRHASFVENTIGKSQWRYRVLDAFWGALRSGNLTRSRLIYQEELLPAFGQRMPRTVQLGMIIADWGSAGATTDELLRRLELLEYEAPELPVDVIARVRNYILDGDKIRDLTKLLQEQKFDALIERVNQIVWTDMPPGNMPPPVAVAQLYAYFKTRNTDVAEDFARSLADSRNLAEWIRDDGALLLGYVSFDKKFFPNAVTAFQKVSRATLLGHDVDRYWAAAQFNEGLQLLEVDNKDKAFEAFARSLNKRGGSENIANLTPLFIHFGLKGIETGNGARAAQAFALASKSIEGAERTPQVAFNDMAAKLGGMLRRALTDEDVTDLEGGKFLDLLSSKNARESLPQDDPLTAVRLERTIRILAICQEMRRQLRLPVKQRDKAASLAKFLHGQAAALEKLEADYKQHDPIVRVLRGVVDLLLTGTGKTMPALDALEGAFRLGVQSPRLAALLERERGLIKQAVARTTKVLDLLDVYLASGEISANFADQLTRNEDLAELYRLDRGYVPADILAEPKQNGIAALRSRLKALLEYSLSEPLNSDPKLNTLSEGLSRLIDQITTMEKQILDVEQKMMQEVAVSLRGQTLDRIVSA